MATGWIKEVWNAGELAERVHYGAYTDSVAQRNDHLSKPKAFPTSWRNVLLMRMNPWICLSYSAQYKHVVDWNVLCFDHIHLIIGLEPNDFSFLYKWFAHLFHSMMNVRRSFLPCFIYLWFPYYWLSLYTSVRKGNVLSKLWNVVQHAGLDIDLKLRGRANFKQ